ncbi:MAG: hypothetical protein GC168_12630 [Candidatus Hydrogenedens sp.]|nr:hypothetical protein [Candidatus Hydrogenedens sp.]
MNSLRARASWIVSFVLVADFAAASDFTDVTAQAGVDYVQHVPFGFGFCQTELGGSILCEPERMTGGAAVGDFDGDGWDDLFVTRFHLPPILFHNNGGGTFSDATAAAGIPEFYRSNCAAWADIDNDQDLDLIVGVTTGLQNRLLINDGAGHFTEEAGFRGVGAYDGQIHITFGIAVGDYDRDGWLDFFTCEWGSYLLGVTNPRPPHHSRLFRNRGAEAPGFFEDVTDPAGVNLRDVAPAGFFNAFGPAFVDLDQDGWLDLAVSSDFGEDHLYWNNGDGTFSYFNDPPVFTTENGMGSTFGDYDGDGDLDWFITSIYGAAQTCGNRPCNWGTTGNRLYRYDGNRTFTDVTDEAGVRNGAWGWGTSFFDYDNDADLDLVMTNGADFPANQAQLGEFLHDTMRFWENDGAGIMTERAAAAGITDDRSGKGLVTFDYDHDGDLDIFVVNNAGHPVLYRNDAATGRFLRVRFVQHGVPVENLHAKVRVTAAANGVEQYREEGASTHFLGQSERTLHFGLGAFEGDTIHAVAVTWPRSGETDVFADTAQPDTTFDIEVPEEEFPTPSDPDYHSADYREPRNVITLSEVLRLVQLFHFGSYAAAEVGTEDGYLTGGTEAEPEGVPHDADYDPEDWQLELNELLRVIQFFNADGYLRDATQPDGFLPIFDTSDRRFSTYGCRNPACN